MSKISPEMTGLMREPIPAKKQVDVQATSIFISIASHVAGYRKAKENVELIPIAANGIGDYQILKVVQINYKINKTHWSNLLLRP